MLFTHCKRCMLASDVILNVCMVIFTVYTGIFKELIRVIMNHRSLKTKNQNDKFLNDLEKIMLIKRNNCCIFYTL